MFNASNAVQSTVIAAIAWTIILGGCSRRPQAAPAANPSVVLPAEAASVKVAEGPRSALTQISESAEVPFDDARTSKWTEAGASRQDLKEAVATRSVAELKPDLLAADVGELSALQRIL